MTTKENLAAKSVKLLAEIITGGSLTSDQVARASELVQDAAKAGIRLTDPLGESNDNVAPLAA